METEDAEPLEGGGGAGGGGGVGEEGVPTEQPQQPIIQPHKQAPSHASRRIGMGMQFGKMGGPAMGLPGLGGASSSTEELVQVIVKSLQEIGVDEMDIREIMQLVKVKVKKLRYSIRLPGEDPKRPIVVQLVEEERAFVASLDTLMTKYLNPLRNLACGTETPGSMKGRLLEIAAGPPLKKSDIDIIFGNIEEIHSLHVVLHDRLKVCLQQWPKIPVSGVFAKLTPKMKTYISYVSHFNNAIETLRACVHGSKTFSTFLQKVGSQQELERLLQAPLQHLTRHRLVLKLLDEQTAITDPEHAVLAGAVKGLKDLQNSIHSNRQCAMQLLGVQNRIQGFKGIVSPGRVFIAEGPLGLLESGVKTDGYVFLFNNMLVFCSPGVAPPQQGAVPQYRFKMKITIDGSVTVKDNASNPTELAPRHSIQVSTTTEQKNFVFIAPKASKKDEWIQHLDSAIYHGSQSKSFGMRLAHLLKREGREGGVPRVVENAIKHLDEHALNVEGLFRISPSAFATNQIKEAIDSGVPVDFASVDNHIVALLLKLFFRELPDCIVPTPLYKDFLSFNETSNPTSRLAQLVDKLHPYHYNLLSYLMSFLSRVASHSDTNRMTATNLGVVFGPNIIWDDNDNDIQSSLKANATLEHMISFYSDIFKTPTKDVSNINPEDEEQEESEDPTFVAPRKRSGLTPLNIAKKIGVGSLLEKEKGDFAKSGGTLISRLLPQRAPSIRPDMKSTSEASLPRPKPKFTLQPSPPSSNRAPEDQSPRAEITHEASPSPTLSPRELDNTSSDHYSSSPVESSPVQDSSVSQQVETTPIESVTPASAPTPTSTSIPAPFTPSSTSSTYKAPIRTMPRPTPPSGPPPVANKPKTHPPPTPTPTPAPSSYPPVGTGSGSRAMRPESTMPCSVCKKPVFGRGCKVLGDYYHVECFVCFHCKAPFPDGAFMVGKDGELYCGADFRALFGKCKGCGEPTKEDEEAVEVLGGIWHPTCFVCTTCRKPFSSGRFLNRGGMPYCKECATAPATPTPTLTPAPAPTPASAPTQTPSPEVEGEASDVSSDSAT